MEEEFKRRVEEQTGVKLRKEDEEAIDKVRKEMGSLRNRFLYHYAHKGVAGIAFSPVSAAIRLILKEDPGKLDNLLETIWAATAKTLGMAKMPLFEGVSGEVRPWPGDSAGGVFIVVRFPPPGLMSLAHFGLVTLPSEGAPRYLNLEMTNLPLLLGVPEDDLGRGTPNLGYLCEWALGGTEHKNYGKLIPIDLERFVQEAWKVIVMREEAALVCDPEAMTLKKPKEK